MSAVAGVFAHLFQVVVNLSNLKRTIQMQLKLEIEIYKYHLFKVCSPAAGAASESVDKLKTTMAVTVVGSIGYR